MKIIKVEPEDIAVGDWVGFKFTNPRGYQLEKVIEVDHTKKPNVKHDSSRYCMLNGAYWEYDLTVAIRIEQ